MTADAKLLADEIERGLRRGIHPEETALIVAALRASLKGDIRCPVCGWVCEEAEREES